MTTAREVQRPKFAWSNTNRIQTIPHVLPLSTDVPILLLNQPSERHLCVCFFKQIAEVKGPGDKLSTKQQIWLEVLESLGANVEVCYVTGEN